MSRTKKTRKISDVMPTRKKEESLKVGKVLTKNGRKLTRYELDMKAWEDKRQRKRKGNSAGSRNQIATKPSEFRKNFPQDSRLGSRKKIPLIVEEIIPQTRVENENKVANKVTNEIQFDAQTELMLLENNECLNQLLDQLEEGQTLQPDEEKFVEECLIRIEELMLKLGISDDEDEDLFNAFERVDLNQYR